MKIDDMSTDTIRKYLEKREKQEEKSKEFIFEGVAYSFKVTNNLEIIDTCSRHGDCCTITSERTVDALKKAIKKWEELKNER